MGQWNKNAKAILRNKENFGDRTIIIHFEDLISNTQAIMQRIANFLEIRYDSILLVPTFNNTPISANTSFTVEKPGIMQSALTRHKMLSDDDLTVVHKLTQNAYDKILKIAPKLS
jgi:hypothetical protein